VLAPDKAPPLIMPLERRLALLADTGMDATVVQPFTREFSTVSADDFIRQVLVRDLGASSVVVGHDFRFGRGRAGDAQLLETVGRELSLSVSVIAPVTVGTTADGQRCSSTRIRQLVQAGDVRGARWLLGRPFELEGTVAAGAARGRTIGFPTANLVPETELRPAVGIYAARAVLLDQTATTHLAAVSIGRNPTFEIQEAPVTVEAHLLDFAGDLYGRRLRLELWERLRDEQKFETVDALVAQIAADVARVRTLMS
jgi:riboflavin kinase/FMN adenylyltransferase